jgi:FKBP-type peptidyl-prolyl cis-trans isomerase FkpA/FKBP-type peptidyl-prolyl cis-trans isomerase FklB
MKKISPPIAASPFVFWRAFALLSLVANVVLFLLFWRTNAKPPAPTLPPPAVTPASVTATKSLPRELAPYASLGSFMAENNRIPDLAWTEAQFAAFQSGFRASYEGRGLPLDDNAKHLRDEISQRVQAMLSTEQPNPLEDYFRTLREKEGVVRTASGLHHRITEPGAGPMPKATDSVVISFSATLPDGTTLPPLTRARVRMVVRDMMPGLAEGVQLLRVGGKALVYVPPDLAYAEKDWPPQLPQHTPLVFFVELHEIVAAP